LNKFHVEVKPCLLRVFNADPPAETSSSGTWLPTTAKMLSGSGFPQQRVVMSPFRSLWSHLLRTAFQESTLPIVVIIPSLKSNSRDGFKMRSMKYQKISTRSRESSSENPKPKPSTQKPKHLIVM